MSSLWEIPAYLIMAFSLALDAPGEKASRVSGLSALSTYDAASCRQAAGLPGFLSDEVWLRAVKTAAPRSDVLAEYGDRIFVTSSGRYYVPSENERDEILRFRSNGQLAARILAAAAAETRVRLEEETGATPSRAALLVAHLYGYDCAVLYMRALNEGPGMRAEALLPQLVPGAGEGMTISLARFNERMMRALADNTSEMAALPGTAGLRAAQAARAQIKGTMTASEVEKRLRQASR